MDSDRPTAPPHDPPISNPNTRTPAAMPMPVVVSKHLEEAYALARTRMAGAPVSKSGFRLFWVRSDETGWIDLPAGGAYAVLGRHTNCEVILRDDPAFSLRHLLATTIDLADGPALRLLDLQTSIPFYLADNMPRTSIVASGPVAVRLGPYVIGGVPVEATGSQPEAPVIPPSLPPAWVSEDSALPKSIRPPAPMPSRPAPSQPAASQIASAERAREDDIVSAPVSYVTSMPPAKPITELPDREDRTPPAGAAAPILHAPARPAEVRPAAVRPVEARPAETVCARVTLQRGGRSATVDLTERELDVGVLIGRAGRCHDGGLVSVLDTSISRGHVLLLRQHGGFEAFDVCSTQGTYRDGRRVRRVTLSDEGTTLMLATTNPVSLTWERAH